MPKINSIVIFILFVPNLLFSQGVFISEIVYDLPGADAGREWIEIVSGEDNLNLANLRLEENKVKHKINFISGQTILNFGDCAVISDNSDKFKVDNPDFTGNLFDSSFSLSNTGENLKILQLISGGKYISLDDINYTPIESPQSDLFSLKRQGGGVFTEKVPNAGICDFRIEKKDNSNFNTDKQNTETEPLSITTALNLDQSRTDYINKIPKIFLEVSGDFETVVGAPLVLHSKVFGEKGVQIKNSRVVWSFGDGYRVEGLNVSHFWHYPGEYYLIVDASSSQSSDTFRKKIIIRQANIDLKILPADDNFMNRIVIKNNGDQDINLGGWFLGREGVFFIFPKNTILLHKGQITIGQELTGFEILPTGMKLFYPNGFEVKKYKNNNKAVSNNDLLKTVSVNPKLQSTNKTKTTKWLPPDNIKLKDSVLLYPVKLKNSQTNINNKEALLATVLKATTTLTNEKSSNSFWLYILTFLALMGAGFIVVYKGRLDEENKLDNSEYLTEEIEKEAKTYDVLYDEDDK